MNKVREAVKIEEASSKEPTAEYATTDDKMELTIPELFGPNANFFYSYGHPDEQDSFLS